MNFSYCEKEKSFTITVDEMEYKSVSYALDKLDYSLYEVDESFCFKSISFSVYCDSIRDEADAKVIYDYVEFHSKYVGDNEKIKNLIEKAKKTFYHDDVEKAIDALHDSISESLRVGRALRAFEKRAKEEAKANAEAEAKSESEMSASESEHNCSECRYFYTSKCPNYKSKEKIENDEDILLF